MSDAVTNVDADDVLAAIRRLVRETRTKKGSTAETQAQSMAGNAPDMQGHAAQGTVDSALVLSPDFRIEQESRAQADSVSDMETVQPTVQDDQSVIDAIQKFMPTPKRPERIDLETATDDTPSIDVTETPAPEATPNIQPERDLRSRIAELEAALDKMPALDDEANEAEEAPSEVADDFDDMPELRDIAQSAAATITDGDIAAPSEASDFMMPRHPRSAVPREDISYDTVTPETPAPEIAEFESAAPESAPSSNAQFTPELNGARVNGAEFNGDVATAHTDLDEADDDGIDLGNITEEAIRSLVGDVLRTELQGEMGERITRNLRRLVRREVQRAVTMRDFQ